MIFFRPTLKDVAKLSGVSEISVSRVMRNAPNISLGLRKKVEAAALKLHYTPNKIAGALASNTTDLIGVVLPTLKNDEYTQILSGIESALAQSKYRMLLGISNFSESRETKIVNDFLAWSPFGVIVAGGCHSGNVNQFLARSKASLVEINGNELNPTDLGLSVSYEKAVADLVSYWLQQGYSRIAYVSSGDVTVSNASFNSMLRLELEKAGIGSVCRLETNELSSITLGMKVCSEIIDQTPNIDAVFFEDGNLAVGASFYCSMMAQDTLDIASLNNSQQIDDSHAKIDLINIPFRKIGIDAANFLIDPTKISASTDNLKTVLPAEFVKNTY